MAAVEHKVVVLAESDLESQLDALGIDGWQLVAVQALGNAHQGQSVRLYFVRSQGR